MTISPTPTEAEKVVAELRNLAEITGAYLPEKAAALIESQRATIESRDDELIGERWHADEAARQRDVWKARAESAEARVTALEAENRRLSHLVLAARRIIRIERSNKTKGHAVVDMDAWLEAVWDV